MTNPNKCRTESPACCPEKLRKYIDLVNDIPQYFEFPYRDEVEKQIKQGWALKGIEWDDSYFDQIYARFVKKLKRLSPRINEFALSGGPEVWDQLKLAGDVIDQDAYLENLDERMYLLESLAWNLTGFARGNTYPSRNRNVIRLRVWVEFSMDDSGYISTSGNELIDLLGKGEIQGTRIRICLSCGKIFWAERVDMKACSKDCANAYRQKKWRNRNKEEYNARRRANYRYKKQGKVLSVNGKGQSDEAPKEK